MIFPVAELLALQNEVVQRLDTLFDPTTVTLEQSAMFCAILMSITHQTLQVMGESPEQCADYFQAVADKIAESIPPVNFCHRRTI